MAIATIVTRGFGNGTFSGTIALVVTRGYTIGVDTANYDTPAHRIVIAGPSDRTIIPLPGDRTIVV